MAPFLYAPETVHSLWVIVQDRLTCHDVENLRGRSEVMPPRIRRTTPFDGL